MKLSEKLFQQLYRKLKSLSQGGEAKDNQPNLSLKYQNQFRVIAPVQNRLNYNSFSGKREKLTNSRWQLIGQFFITLQKYPNISALKAESDWGRESDMIVMWME